MPRIGFDQYFMDIAIGTSKRGTCRRRTVGCVLMSYDNHIISTGYNGNPNGQPHCLDIPCPGAQCKSGEGLDLCEAIHAEINALIHCQDVSKVHKCYSTLSPCIFCVKALLASPCKEIVFLEEYPHKLSKKLWEKSGRIWRQYNATN